MLLKRICLVLIVLFGTCSMLWAGPMIHDWSQRFGDAAAQYGYSTAVDGSGNVIVTGRFWGTVDFGGGTLTSAGSADIYVAKFDAAGDHLWSQPFGDASAQAAYSTVVDGSGNVIITGVFWGTVDFGGGTLTSAGNTDIYVAKFDAAGAHQWSKRFGDATTEYSYSVAVDGSGNVIITGWFYGTVDFGGGLMTSAGSADMYVAKFDADGNHLWSKHFGDESGQAGRSVAVDASGNIIATGEFYGTVDFGGDTLTTAGGADIHVAMFDSDGSHLWSDGFGGLGQDYGFDVAADGSGNVVVTGWFWGAVDFGGGTLTSAGGTDIFVAKFDAAGTHMWSQGFGDASSERGNSVAADGSGNVIITGEFEGTVDFGGGMLTSAGDSDIYIAEFDATGDHLWSQRFGDVSQQTGRNVEADGLGNVVVTGDFAGTVDFGGGLLTSAGELDIFVAKFQRAAVCQVQPVSIDFGTVFVGRSKDTTFTIKNTGGGMLSGSVSTSCVSHYQIVATVPPDDPYQLAHNEELLVTVRFEPVDVGTHVCTVETGDVLCSDVTCTGLAEIGPWVDATSGPLGDTGQGRGVAWGDCDGDGDLDLYVSNTLGDANKLFRNDGAGVFSDATSGPLGDTSNGMGIAWGDYDNDGDLDLYLVNGGGHANKLFRNDGGGTFVDATSGPLGDAHSGQGMAWGDYDNDGNVDLYVANGGSDANKLFRNNGDGTFLDATSGPLGDTGACVGVAWGDYDNDGDLDLYLSRANQTNKLLRNDGGGVFVDATSGPLGDAGLGAGVDWGDYDNDGDLDLYLANWGTSNKLFRNDGGGTFADATTGPLGDTGQSRGVAWGDYDNDGDLDLYLTNWGTANKLFRNEGGGTFVDAMSGPSGDTGAGTGVAWGDYDNDGDLDLYVACYGQANRLFRNDQSTGNHWLHVDLAGISSNRCGIGARVRVVAGGSSQIREISGGSGDMSQNSLVAEFGLGSATTVDTFEVKWPNGMTEVITGDGETPAATSIAVDRMIIILEGWGIVTGIDPETGPVFPKRYALYQNVPNPFNPTTVIRYDVAADGSFVTLLVYDVGGRLVRTLVNRRETAGHKMIAWDAKNDHGRRVATGIYFYQLKAKGFSETRKMLLLK